MNATWDDEYLTVIEIAERLKLNPQTVRNYIDQGRLPAVRIGRRVGVRRADVDRLLAECVTAPIPPTPEPSGEHVAKARDELAQALERSRRLLGRRSAARRTELAAGLQDLSEAVAAALQTLSEALASPVSSGRGGVRRGVAPRARLRVASRRP